ncbi:MAG: endonuclease/exonuclease/phosphatase family protein [Candidatus Limnocylindrales bacterium]
MAATLRVATWNIRSAIGPGPFPDRWWSRIDADRLRAIGAFLSGLDADLIALQECALVSHDGQLIDNAGDLARQLGMEIRYGATRSFEVIEDGLLRGVGSLGNAVLSRWPVLGARTVALPAAPIDALIEEPGVDHPTAGIRYADADPTIREPRCLLVVDLDGLRVGTTHLSHIGSGERRLQAEAVQASFADVSPALLLGDLNARIDSPELAALAGWTDGFAAPLGDAARISTDDDMLIDQVLVRGATVTRCAVVPASVTLSDHYPLVAELATP